MMPAQLPSFYDQGATAAFAGGSPRRMIWIISPSNPLISFRESTATLATATSPFVPSRVVRVDNQILESTLAHVEPRKIAPAGAGSTSARLKAVQSKLALSITQLAELLSVTRKTIYDWLEGAPLRRSAEIRIFALHACIEDAPKELDLQRLKLLWNTPVSDQSFLSILNQDQPTPDELQAALREKLSQLAPRLNTPPPLQVGSMVLGNAHSAEFNKILGN